MKRIASTAYILLLDDEEELRLTMQDYLEAAGHHVTAVSSALRAEEAMRDGQFDVAILDVMLPDGNGLELLKKFKDMDNNMGIILITGYAEVNTATQALRWGADDFFSKPCDIEDILLSVKQRLHKTNHQEPQPTQIQQKEQQCLSDNLIGESAAIKRLQLSIPYFSQSASPIFISGATGTGKTKLANILCALNTPEQSSSLLSLNCEDMPENYRFSSLEHGTLILENIDQLHKEHQQALMQCLQKQGVRLISTASSDQLNLPQKLINLIQNTTIHLPPLVERDNDVLLLAEHFLNEFKSNNQQAVSINEEAQTLLFNYPWRGNVRELKDCIQQAFVVQKNSLITADDLPHKLRDSSQDFANINAINLDSYHAFSLKEALAKIEKQALEAALKRFDWNQFHTAKFLHMNRTTLIEKIKERGLKKP